MDHGIAWTTVRGKSNPVPQFHVLLDKDPLPRGQDAGFDRFTDGELRVERGLDLVVVACRRAERQSQSKVKFAAAAAGPLPNVVEVRGGGDAVAFELCGRALVVVGLGERAERRVSVWRGVGRVENTQINGDAGLILRVASASTDEHRYFAILRAQRLEVWVWVPGLEVREEDAPVALRCLIGDVEFHRGRQLVVQADRRGALIDVAAIAQREVDDVDAVSQVTRKPRGKVWAATQVGL